MTPVFVDTSFLLALTLKDDAHHAAALAWQRKVVGSLLTTELVLLEYLDALAQPRTRAMALRVRDALCADAQTRVVPATTELMGRAVELYRSRADKRWGLTDCASFVVMGDAGASDALTLDSDFTQAGFRALLREAGA